MTKFDLENEKNAIDIFSSSMHSLGFLRNITTAIFDDKVPSMTVREFYEKNAEFSNNTEFIPYHFGPIVGNLYCGLLLAKEYWLDLLPDDELPMSDPKWGLSGVACTSPKKANPTVKYVIRRIRNALGHGSFVINFPEGTEKSADKHGYEKKLTIKFHDENQRDSSDTFDIELSLYRLYIIIKRFHEIAYRHVTSKK
jgi:hypothetical protein